MKKILIIGLLFVSCVLSAQIGSWDSTQAIIYPTSTTLKIPLSATDTIYGIDVLPSDSGNSYINRISKVQLIYDFTNDATDDTIPAVCLFANFDYDSLVYTRISEKTINSDSTLNLPNRITEFEVYSSASSSSIPVPDIEVGAAYVPGDYATIQAAVTGEGVDGIIYVRSGTYKDASYTTFFQNSQVIGIGDVIWQSTSTSYLARSNGGTTIIKNMTLDSETNTTYNVFTTAGYTEVENCYLQDATTYSVYESAADSFLTSKCVIVGSVTHCAFGADMKVSETFMNTSGTSCIYVLSEATVKDIYNEYNYYKPDVIQYIHWIRSNGNYFTRYNTYDIGINLTNQVEVREGSYDGEVNFYGNTTNTSFASTALIWRAYKGNTFDINIYDNTWNWTAQGDGSCIRISDVDTVNIYGNTFYSEQSIDYEYISVTSAEAATNCTTNVRENDFNIRNLTGYGIRIGEEAAGTGDNNITALIEKNRIFGALYHDSTLTGVSFHGVFNGFQDGTIMRYNYVKGAGFNELFKGSSSGDYYGNISINGTTLLRLKGATNINIYNNAFYSDIPITSQVLSLTENLGSDPSSCIFKNNIIQTVFNTNTKTLYNIQDNSAIDADYNVVYTDTDLYASVNLTPYNWTAWQGLGNDANSFNSDPNFKSSTELWPISPSDAYLINPTQITPSVLLDTNSSWSNNVITDTTGYFVDAGAYKVSSDFTTDTIDWAGSDVTWSNVTNKINNGIEYSNRDLDGIVLGVDSLGSTAYKTNQFIKLFEPIQNDTIVYGTDPFSTWVIKINASLQLLKP